MTYMDGGVTYISRPSEKRYQPRTYIADGIRRMAEAGELKPGTVFVPKEEYDKLETASELVAADLAQKNYFLGYGRGRLEGMIASTVVVAVIVVLLALLSGCKTVPAAKVTTASPAYLLAKFTANPKAWPVEIVDDNRLKTMGNCPVLMVKITDTATTAQELRTPRPKEPAMLIRIVTK